MLAIVFPGQGSQSVGMLKEMNEAFPIVREHFDKASSLINIDLWDIAQNNPEEKINYTQYTQPILFTAGYACYEIFKQEIGVKADYFAGHSLGEYTALAASGALSFEEGVKLVFERGKIMQDAVAFGAGAMAAILGLDNKAVAEICHAVGDVYPANFNCTGQVVIGGKTAQVDKAIALAKEKGAKRALLLPVSVPSHTPLMKTAAARFGIFLDRIQWKEPTAPIIFNVDAAEHKDKFAIMSALGSQLYKPVLWRDCVVNLAEKGVSEFIEIGAGKVLCGLIKRIDKNLKATHIDSPNSLEEAKKFLAGE